MQSDRPVFGWNFAAFADTDFLFPRSQKKRLIVFWKQNIAFFGNNPCPHNQGKLPFAGIKLAPRRFYGKKAFSLNGNIQLVSRFLKNAFPKILKNAVILSKENRNLAKTGRILRLNDIRTENGLIRL